jgi:hypothetical protein
MDEIELLVAQCAVKYPTRHGPDLFLPDTDRAGRESPIDEASQLVVTRRVHVDHRLPGLDLVWVEVLERGTPYLGGEDLDVAMYVPDVLVAGHCPEAGASIRLRIPVDRILAPQLRERRVRHRVDERVVVGQVYVAERPAHV